MAHATIYMDAELAPSRSLTERDFTRVMLFIGGVLGIIGLWCLAQGFLPVIGFLGLDVALVWWIFKRSFQKQRQRTYVKVTTEWLDMRHVDERGQEVNACLPTAFARVELDPEVQRGQIKVSASGKAYIIGRFLPPLERKEFAQSLKDALRKARAERYA